MGSWEFVKTVFQNKQLLSGLVSPETGLTLAVVEITSPSIAVTGTPVVFLEATPILLDSTICEGDTIEIAGEFYTQSGNYNIELTSTQGCDSTIDLTVSVLDPFVSIFPTNIIDCNNPTVTVLSNFNGSGNVTYNWTGQGIVSGNGTPNIQVFLSGPYTLDITVEENGVVCNNTAITFVEENTFPPFANAGFDQTLDCATGTAVLTAVGQPWANCEEYFWTGPNNFFGSGLSITVTEPGTYTLEVLDFCNGCFAQDQVVVVDGGNNQLDIGDDITLDCNNTPVVIQPNIINTNAGTTYQWITNNGNIIAGANTPTPTVDAAGTYFLEVDNGNCMATDEVEVLSFATGADAGEDATLTCNTVTATIGGSNTAVGTNISYLWQNSNGSVIGNSITTVVNTAGTYTLIVTDNAVSYTHLTLPTKA